MALHVPIDKIIPLTDVRDNFSRLVADIESQEDGIIIITKGGKPAIALLSIQYLETISNSNAPAQIKASVQYVTPKPNMPTPPTRPPEPITKTIPSIPSTPPPPKNNDSSATAKDSGSQPTAASSTAAKNAAPINPSWRPAATESSTADNTIGRPTTPLSDGQKSSNQSAVTPTTSFANQSNIKSPNPWPLNPPISSPPASLRVEPPITTASPKLQPADQASGLGSTATPPAMPRSSVTDRPTTLPQSAPSTPPVQANSNLSSTGPAKPNIPAPQIPLPSNPPTEYKADSNGRALPNISTAPKPITASSTIDIKPQSAIPAPPSVTAPSLPSIPPSPSAGGTVNLPPTPPAVEPTNEKIAANQSTPNPSQTMSPTPQKPTNIPLPPPPVNPISIPFDEPPKMSSDSNDTPLPTDAPKPVLAPNIAPNPIQPQQPSTNSGQSSDKIPQDLEI